MKSNFIGIIMVFLLGAMASPLSAAETSTGLTTQATRMDSYASSKGQATVISKTAADFSSFYGQDNAQALSGGLRSGTEVYLVTYGADGKTIISEASFTPPTASMGNGNAYISMSLAQQQLTAAGITQPSAQQIQAAMVGGPLASGGQPAEGVLQMRASGMGWGQIAHSLGVNLGHVISGMKSANAALARTSAQSGIINATEAGKVDTAKPKTSTSGGRSGVVTAAGSGGANVLNSKGSGGRKSGIVTGAGAVDGRSSGGGAGKGQAHGAGIVTTGGGGGQGNAYGKGGK